MPLDTELVISSRSGVLAINELRKMGVSGMAMLSCIVRRRLGMGGDGEDCVVLLRSGKRGNRMSVPYIVTEQLQNALPRLKTWRSYFISAISLSSFERRVSSINLPLGSVPSEVFEIKESGVRCGEGGGELCVSLRR
jgi:hypothetical protein